MSGEYEFCGGVRVCVFRSGRACIWGIGMFLGWCVRMWEGGLDVGESKRESERVQRLVSVCGGCVRGEEDAEYIGGDICSTECRVEIWAPNEHRLVSVY